MATKFMLDCKILYYIASEKKYKSVLIKYLLLLLNGCTYEDSNWKLCWILQIIFLNNNKWYEVVKEKCYHVDNT